MRLEKYVGKINYLESEEDLRSFVSAMIKKAKEEGLSREEAEEFVCFVLEILLEHERIDGPFPWSWEFEEPEYRESFFTSILEFAQKVAREKYGVRFQFIDQWADLKRQGYITFIIKPKIDCVKAEFYGFMSIQGPDDLAILLLPLWKMIKRNSTKRLLCQ